MSNTKKSNPTRQKILESAIQIFIDKGFEGTSISDIAKQAETNKSLIYHHFEDKQDLWKKAKSYLLEQYYDKTISDLETQSNRPFREFLETVITQRYIFYRDNPKIAKLIAWQNLEKTGPSLKGVDNPALSSFSSQIRDYQVKGDVRTELNPDMISYMIMMSASTPFITIPSFFLDPNQKEKNQKDYLNMLIDTLYRSFSTEI